VKVWFEFTNGKRWETSMNPIQIFTLVIATAIFTPAAAQKSGIPGITTLSIPKPVIAIPKMAVPGPTLSPTFAPSISAPPPGIVGTAAPQIAVDKKDPGSAAISTQDLKPIVDIKGLNDQKPASGGVEVSRQSPGGEGSTNVKAKLMGLEGEDNKTLGSTLMIGGGKAPGSGAQDAIENVVGQQGPITDGKYADTFGGGRVNAKSQGSVGGFAGDGKGNTSDSPNGLFLLSPGAPVSIPYPGSVSAGEKQDRTPIGAGGVLIGTDKNIGTTSGNEAGTIKGVVTSSPAGKTRRERDDDMGASGGPMSRGELKTFERGSAGRTGAAGGSNDGRADRDGKNNSGGGITALNKADGAEREAGTGTINMNEALKINTVVNPGSAAATR
jgi:hypothetical protein